MEIERIWARFEPLVREAYLLAQNDGQEVNKEQFANTMTTVLKTLVNRNFQRRVIAFTNYIDALR